MSSISDLSSPTPGLPSTLSVFLVIVILVSVLLGGVFTAHFLVDQQAEKNRQQDVEWLNVNLARNALVVDLDEVTTDLLFLKTMFEQNLPDLGSDVQLTHMAEVFRVFAEQKAIYDQIRLLDTRGRETIRVNWSAQQASLVSQAQLQDKSARYYFQQALQLQPGQIYVSPFDLNVEGGEIEQPIKPVIRVATGVYSPNGDRRGIIILNYLGNRLLERFLGAGANIGDHLQLLNVESYWLSSPRPDEAWAFMFGRDVSFVRRYPQAWQRISGNQSGQFSTAAGLFTFDTVIPARELLNPMSAQQIDVALQANLWKVVAHLAPDQDPLGFVNFVERYISLYGGILLILMLLAYLFATSHVQRRRAETQQAYEQKFRRILEDMALLALMLDRDGRVTFCNHYFLQHGHWSGTDVVGQLWLQRFVTDQDREAALRDFNTLLNAGHYPKQSEYRIVTAEADQRLIAWNNTIARDTGGRISGLTLIGEDITDSRQAEEQVRKLSSAVEQSPASVVITDREGMIEYVNPKFSQVTGYSAFEVVGRNPSVLKSGETPAHEYRKMWQALNSGGEWRGEFHNRRKDGSLYWEAAVISALRDPDGQITHFLAVKEDITERKRLQQEVDLRNLELARAQALTAMGKMASMLAHDLSNPLSSIKMAVKILGNESNSQHAEELASISQEQITYMEGIIDEMLTYARPGELDSAWLDAEKLINAVTGTVQRRLDEAGADLQVKIASGLPTFPGDASKLRQLLGNLIVNAIQACNSRPIGNRIVAVTAGLIMTDAGRRIEFRICDSGVGIDPGIAERIFEPFFTTRARGTGLGLAIVKQIADLHGATIQFEANQPAGTCAVLSLPLTPIATTWRKAEVQVVDYPG